MQPESVELAAGADIVTTAIVVEGLTFEEYARNNFHEILLEALIIKMLEGA